MSFLLPLDFHLVGPTSQIVVLDSPLVWERPLTQIMVGTGFACDLASVPRLLTALAPPWQQSGRAGVLHDYLYRNDHRLAITRKGADNLFQLALLADGVSSWRAWAMWAAVRAGGGASWQRKSVGWLP